VFRSLCQRPSPSVPSRPATYRSTRAAGRSNCPYPRSVEDCLLVGHPLRNCPPRSAVTPFPLPKLSILFLRSAPPRPFFSMKSFSPLFLFHLSSFRVKQHPIFLFDLELLRPAARSPLCESSLRLGYEDAFPAMHAIASLPLSPLATNLFAPSQLILHGPDTTSNFPSPRRPYSRHLGPFKVTICWTRRVWKVLCFLFFVPH